MSETLGIDLVHLSTALTRLAPAQSVSEVLEILTTEISDAVGATSVCVARPKGEDSLEFLSLEGFSNKIEADWATIPLRAQTPLTNVFRSGKAEYYGSRTELLFKYPKLAGALQHESGAWAAIPLGPASEPFGVLGFVWGGDREFAESDRLLMDTLCQIGGQTLRRVQAEQNRDALMCQVAAIADEERKRIAEDLHDGPIQWLASADLTLTTMRRLETFDTERFHRIESILHRAMESLRSLMFQLYAPDLEAGDLTHAVSVLIDSVMSGTEIEVVSDLSLVREFDDGPIRRTLLRVLQESLSNVKMHSEASTVLMTLSEDGDGLHLEVADDGVGFDPPVLANRVGHLGLQIMEDRARSVGGDLVVTSQPGGGTSINARFPLEAPEMR